MKKFAKAILNENDEIFIVLLSFFSIKSIYPNKKAHIAPLLIEKVTVPDKYSDFTNFFAEK